ncbi:MAG: AmmeMemoRadiSam system protein A [Coriobacteriales bacterium]|jgi:AmmeMemoRadiSam system protein A|nr:AmmeMemoRadiSam system protein A [Coriobacteriales bacterium]
MSIKAAFVLPHPPLLIPGIGDTEKPRVRATHAAYEEVARQIAALEPETIVVFSPHATLCRDYFQISAGQSAQGNFAQFGLSGAKLRYTVRYDNELVGEVSRLLKEVGLPGGSEHEYTPELDHGFLVPWHFIARALRRDTRVVRIGLSGLALDVHHRFGQCVAAASDALDRRVVIVASGDLSHRLLAEGPYGFAPEGPQFDHAIVEILRTGNLANILAIDENLSEQAGECGLRSFAMMAGALDTLTVTPRLFSYEGPFGVGYAVARFIVTPGDAPRATSNKWEQDVPGAHDTDGEHTVGKAADAEKKDTSITASADAPVDSVAGKAADIATVAEAAGLVESVPVALARATLVAYFRVGERPNRNTAEITSVLAQAAYAGTAGTSLLKELDNRAAGVFVSLHRQGELRGCIGTIGPTTKSTLDEIIQNAVSAAVEDPRFSPLDEAELSGLEIKVDVLGAAEPVSGLAELDAQRYGVIVSRDFRRGLLLPALEGVDTPAQQVEIALRKADISPTEPYQLQRFEVVRYQ